MKYLAIFALAIALIISCGDDDTMSPTNPVDDMGNDGDTTNVDGNMMPRTIWTGAPLTFTKADDTDPTASANQDRITENVWITRGVEGGQIYNISEESSSDKSSSPTGTQWARGTTADIDNLTFNNFRTTIKPSEVVGVDMVLHLVTDDIYLDIKFESWTSGKKGGFSYTRSTP